MLPLRRARADRLPPVGRCPVSGRVGFSGSMTPAPVNPPRHSTWKGVPACSAALTDSCRQRRSLSPLARRLLGHTWICRETADAVALAQMVGPGCGFVTLRGEVLTPDGNVGVGHRQGARGRSPARSELRALEGQCPTRRPDRPGRVRVRRIQSQIDSQRGSSRNRRKKNTRPAWRWSSSATRSRPWKNAGARSSGSTQ